MFRQNYLFIFKVTHNIRIKRKHKCADVSFKICWLGTGKLLITSISVIILSKVYKLPNLRYKNTSG